MNSVKGWKTIIFNLAIALIGVLEAVEWIDIVPEGYGGIIAIIIGGVGIWLRKQTTTPVPPLGVNAVNPKAIAAAKVIADKAAAKVTTTK